MESIIYSTLNSYLNWWKEHRFDVLDPTFQGQEIFAQKMYAFASEHPDCFSRTCKAGHFTASAFVVSPCGEKVLLTHHAKLKKWVHLGGHADGDPLLYRSAEREVFEESGIKEMEFLLFSKIPVPFDIDIHWFPDTPKEMGHWHFDVCYPVRALRETIAISDESIDLRWIDRGRLALYTEEESILRMNFKIDLIINSLVDN